MPSAAPVPCILFDVNEALFGIERDDEPAEGPGPSQQPVRDDQIAAIREAFTLAGIDTQERRREIAQSCSIRPLTSLRDLTAAEAHRLLKRMKENAAAKPRPVNASDWDLRDEETWIDKM